MNDWLNESNHVNMGVISDGNFYGVPEGLIFSFPLNTENGEWKVINGIDNSSEEIRARLDATINELLEERKIALGY